MNNKKTKTKEAGMSERVEGRFYPPYDDDPKYGVPFQVKAVQPVNIKREYYGWTPMILGENFEEGGNLVRMGNNMQECQKIKEKLSDLVVSILNYGKIKVPIKEIVAFKIHYLGDPIREVHII